MQLTELVSAIAENVQSLKDFVNNRGLAEPSFDDGLPTELLQDQDAGAARMQVLEATDELHSLLLGPVELLTTPPHNFLISLHVICQFDLAPLVPLEGSDTTFIDIAEKRNLDVSIVQRILRHAIAHRIFKESQPGRVTHTAASKRLVTDPGVTQWIGMVASEMWPAATKTADAIQTWPGSQEPNNSGFNKAFGTESHLFEEFRKHPARAKRYGYAMSWLHSRPGFEINHTGSSFDWSSLAKGSSKTATVVDVGGSHGRVAIELAQRFPSLRLIVQDLPEVVKEGRRLLPIDIEDRVSFMSHDFFNVQPVKGADVYLLRSVLHDWSDKYAIKILRALVPAMKEGTRVFVQEHVLPSPGILSAYQEKKARAFDLAMMEFHNAKERDMNEWLELLKEADQRFALMGSKKPEGSRLEMLEFEWNSFAGE